MLSLPLLRCQSFSDTLPSKSANPNCKHKCVKIDNRSRKKWKITILPFVRFQLIGNVLQQTGQFNVVLFVNCSAKIGWSLQPHRQRGAVMLETIPIGLSKGLNQAITQHIVRQWCQIFQRIDHGPNEIVVDLYLQQYLKWIIPKWQITTRPCQLRNMRHSHNRKGIRASNDSICQSIDRLVSHLPYWHVSSTPWFAFGPLRDA